MQINAKILEEQFDKVLDQKLALDDEVKHLKQYITYLQTILNKTHITSIYNDLADFDNEEDE